MRVLCRTAALGNLPTYRLASLEVGLSWQDIMLVIPVFLKRQLIDLNVKK